MPDALPPVGVLLSALDAATLPLAGTETTFVMQGGQPKQTPVSSIGGTPAFYARRGTHTPTLTPNSGTTATSPAVWLWTRIGNGAGVPAAGDEVTLKGKVQASRGVVGEGTFSVTLPFVPVDATAVGLINTFPALGGLAFVSSGVASVNLANLEASTIVQVEITFQTANAVDP